MRRDAPWGAEGSAGDGRRLDAGPRVGCSGPGARPHSPPSPRGDREVRLLSVEGLLFPASAAACSHIPSAPHGAISAINEACRDRCSRNIFYLRAKEEPLEACLHPESGEYNTYIWSQQSTVS